jgi:CBS-domain-containing membrane protein
MYHKVISGEKTGDWTDEAGAAVRRFVCAEDLMGCEPVFLRTYFTIQRAIEAFCKQHMSSLLVAGENPLDRSLSLSGRVSLKDVFRLLFPGLLQKDPILFKQVLRKPIENILIYPQKTIHPNSDIAEILSVMLEEGSSVAPVVHNGVLVGQICSKDLLDLFKPIDGKDGPGIQLIQRALPESARVSGAMARHVLCLSPKDEISKGMGVLMVTETLAIPVLDEQGNLRQIISRMDVLECILEFIEPKELNIFEQKGLILDRRIGTLDEKGFTTISADDSLVNAVKIMIEKNNFCLAVTDTHRRFSGLLTFTDILNWMYVHLKEQSSLPVS